MSGYNEFKTMVDENDVRFVDLRFTDPRGRFHHLSMCVEAMDQDTCEGGVPFDGSSINGWKPINESDMLLKPDMSTAVMDPFAAQPQIILFCNIVDPITLELYDRDPRSVAIRAEEYVKTSGVGDTVFFGPEAEFFMFDDVKIQNDMNKVMYEVSSEEGPYLGGATIEGGNMAHRPSIKGGYFPVAPVDKGSDIRAEMVAVCQEMGLPMDKHHHEVAPSQHELGMEFGTMVESADRLQLQKYVIQNVAAAYGKTCTFMPKPVYGDNGSGMHCNQSIWKDGKPTFAGDGYAGLSDNALYYIGGIIKHAKAINAFSNPSTNSYKRLIPGFEAPVLLAYSSRNRSASCRIPFGFSPKSRRVEIRFPDPTANPYLCFSAMLMAGLDGIANKIHPGDAMDKDLYDLPAEELKGIPTVAGSLREALEALEADHEFLLKGDVFTKSQLEGYMALKWEECHNFEHRPHPIEFEMYYSC
ncbi:MAG: type I glutamate--ammonia ligase [Alphaproteobacteria bacterium]